MSEYTMTIDGQSVRAKETLGVVDPATGDVFAQVPSCTKDQLDQAMAAAARAYPSWSRDVGKRKEALIAASSAIKANVSKIAPILTQEQGKPLQRATEEVVAAAVWLKYNAGLDLPVEVVQDDEKRRVEVRRKPVGVVAAITPWNFPLLSAMTKVAPALAAGNTVVLKPSPFTPAATLAIASVLRDVLPPGVLNVVSGGDDLGAAMTAHPVVRKISFTGSIATGKKVAAAAAPDLKRVTLELGGNDPAIVLADVDPKVAAKKLFWGAFANSGQVCAAIKRLYVHESIYEPVVAELAALAKSVKVGNGLEEGVELGPINNKPQFERVSMLVEDAKKHGATFAAGGERIGERGYFFQPTIVTGVAEGTKIVDEEQFGPALPVMPYSDVADAIRRANETHFGLSGSVWSNDVEKATEVAGQLECGSAWVNQHIVVLPNIPFGGAKWSGIGVENGPWGLLGFTEIQVVNVAKS
jgi:acyl-CoA reductase-like NAD-dependent aldehyde dehydrogenase